MGMPEVLYLIAPKNTISFRPGTVKTGLPRNRNTRPSGHGNLCSFSIGQGRETETCVRLPVELVVRESTR